MRVRIIGNSRLRKYYLLFAILPFLFWSCNSGNEKKGDGLPILTPEESLEHFHLADDNLSVHLVAAEPLVQAPVAMKFDARGRIWAVEMMGYMPDTAGTGENTNPNGKIVILEDQNGDGKMDHRKVFMDSLVLPRAICFYKNGLLIAEPPELWFVEIKNDIPGTKYLVDSRYAVGGNVEHQPNGLLRGLDNWIYSAKSDVRYREINGKWVKEHTHFRGQWGITQDDDGRLFYNNNSMNLLGDYFPPGLGAKNPHQHSVSGYNEAIVSDNRTYPVHPTPGVNRGYQPKVLDDSLRLVNLTGACGPVIYRSGLLPSEYYGNAFVAGPVANLVKRDVLQKDGFVVKGKQAYKGREFLASDDERFRPVSLYNGPEGALYIVDMYRGIIQDVTYLTPYLKQHIIKNDLSTPLNRGRIYKITPKNKNPSVPDISRKTTKELVHLLNSHNAWVRMTAQRLITDFHKTEAIPFLKDQLKNSELPGKIQTFWTLEGLDALSRSEIQAFLASEDIRLRQQALSAAIAQMDKDNALQWLNECTKLAEKPGKQLAPYVAFLCGSILQFTDKAMPVLKKLALQYPDNRFVADAVISGLYNREEAFYEKIKGKVAEGSTLSKRLIKAIAVAEEGKKEKKKKSRYAKGKVLFATYCKICHGENGEGLQSLGPPLAGSQWVTGNKEKVLAIVLHGLTGQIKVGDKIYKTPEIAGEMPAFSGNDKLSDEDIAQILSYIRNAWSNNAESIGSKEVGRVRKKYEGRQKPFTMKELQNKFPSD